METTIIYKGYVIKTINIATNDEESVAFKDGQPIKGTAADYGKYNSVEKLKIKLDEIKDGK